MRKIICLMLIAVIFVTLCSCSGSKYEGMSVDELLALGTKYCQESNYEEAIIVYTAIIEIDDKCVEAYFELSKVYNYIGNIEEAIGVLERGIKATEDEKLKGFYLSYKMKQTLEAEGEGFIPSVEQWTVLDKSIKNADIHIIREMAKSKGYEVSECDGDDFWMFIADVTDSNVAPELSVYQSFDSPHIESIGYDHGLYLSENV